MSILLLISDSAILPIQKEEFDKNPIKVFELFYLNYPISDVIPFSEWLNKYIVSENVLDLGENSVKKKIQDVLSNPEKIKRTTLKLYPEQLIVSKKNWVKIQKEINIIYYKKRLRYFSFSTFNAFEKMLKNNLEVVLDV